MTTPVKINNVDGTPNKQGMVTNYVDTEITIAERKEPMRLNVMGLENQKVILGFPWLKASNPTIDWKEETALWNDCKTTFQETPPSSDNSSIPRRRRHLY